ncbi:hypothetical protein PoB_005770000 [Plakobranchus ocellatus]|uniref:Uncharacterized protein n=1 Tax=Plakobranchus ocellatus TaxID=259542 RepID=A0AAV4CEH4_9GAST|nr:hypothetical protein PoB_005770000 [Plakobranchus ocellatus]
MSHRSPLNPCFPSTVVFSTLNSRISNVVRVITVGYCIQPVHNKLISDCKPSVRPGRRWRARTHDRRVPADLRADSQATVPPTPPCYQSNQ